MTRSRRKQESGFALLLVMAMAAIIAVMLYREMPRVAFEGQRAKEDLLIQRGEQYYRAIQLYTRKFSRYPGTLEQLENTNNVRFLRRRYKDPMTGKEEWRIIHAGPGGIFTDSLTQKPPQPLGKDGKPTGTSPFGSTASSFGSMTSSFGSTPETQPQQAQTQTPDPNAPKPGWRPRRPSDMAGFTPPPAQEGEQSAEAMGFAPPQEPGEPQYSQQQGENPQGQPPPPGQLQYPYAQGQIQTVAPGQVMQPQPGQPGGMVQSGGMVMSGSMGFQQPGVAPQGSQPGAQAPGAPPQGAGPQPGFQPSEPPDPNDPGVSQGSPDQAQPQPPPQPAYPPNVSTLPQNYSQQRPGPFVNQQAYVQQQQPSINPVTPYMPQPPVQTNPGQTGQQPVSTNPVDLINQQLRGGGQRPGLGGPGGQALGAGIAGVASTSEMEGIKVYNKHTKYNEWEFIYDQRKDLTSPASRAMIPQPGLTGGGTPAVPGAGQKK